MAKYNENAVREAAYFMWQNAGCPAGSDEYFWALAIEQLNGKCSKACAAKKAPAKKAAKKGKASSSLTLKKLMK